MGLSSYARCAGYVVMFCDWSPGLRLGLPSFAHYASWKLWGARLGRVHNYSGNESLIIWGMKPC